MNTRGEQLELHEIAKAKFLEVLDTEHDKKTAALIWEKCSDMDSYIQMNFDPKVRKALLQKIGLASRIILTILIQLENVFRMMKMINILFL